MILEVVDDREAKAVAIELHHAFELSRGAGDPQASRGPSLLRHAWAVLRAQWMSGGRECHRENAFRVSAHRS